MTRENILNYIIATVEKSPLLSQSYVHMAEGLDDESLFNLMCLIYLFEKERKEKGDEYFTKRFLEIKTALPKIKIDARKDTYLSKEKKENENIESELERLMGTL